MTSKLTILTKSLLAFLLVFTSGKVLAQLSGTKTIPGDYADITSAINDLNSLGVSPTGVTFDVAAGYTETSTLPVITASGTSAGPVIFQKSGAGANPLLVSGTGTGTLDGIIRLAGADYITFNGIDVSDNAANTTTATQAEWGYALLKSSGTNGCQYISIINSTISLTRSNTSSVGIYVANHTSLASTSVTVTATSGANSYNVFNSNTINNCYTGVRLAGFAATTPFAEYDQENKVGSGGANTITNFGGGTAIGYGIYCIYQNKVELANNTLVGGSNTHTTTLYGINLSTGTNSNVDIFGNSVTLTTNSTTSSTYGINNSMGSTGTNNQVNIYNNVVKNLSWPTVTSGVFYSIYNQASCYNIAMSANTVQGNAKGGTGAFYGIYNSGSVVNKAIMNNNLVFNNASTSTGTFYGINSNPGTATNSDVYDNQVYNNTNGGTFYPIYTITGNVTNVTTNLVYNNTTSGTTMYGIYISSGTTVNVSRNKVYSLTSNGTTGVCHGIYTNAGTTHNVSNNLVGDLRAPLSSNINAVTGLYLDGGTTTNAYYNTVYLNASSSAANFGSSAIYATATPTATLMNNIFVNNSTANGTGLTVAHRRATAVLTDFATASNNNLYFAGTPSATNVIFYDGTNSDQTIAAYKTRVTPRETAAISENPPFLSLTGSAVDFLHINGAISSGVESGAAPITGFEDDYDALAIRTGYPLAAQVNGGGTAPDIGADEGDFTPVNLDMGATLLIKPVSGTCHPIADTVRVSIKNYTAVTIDFSVNPVTINAAVTGINPVTFTPVVISTGTLAGGDTLHIDLSTTYSMSAVGNYTFTATTSLTGDGNATNNSMIPVSIDISGGIATASVSPICLGSSATMTVSGHSGSIQWQSYDQTTSSWINETGSGNTSTSYTVAPTDTMIYRALTCGIHPSVADTINIIEVSPAIGTGGSRCGAGPVTLMASGAPVINWYTAATGGVAIAQGSTYTPTVSATTTFYAESFAPSSAGSPIKITELDLGNTDGLEIQNLSPNVINTAGWVVAISNSYTNINLVNTILWNLPATMQPGEVLFKNDATGPNDWGNNILWNPGNFPGFAGWAIILDNNGNIMDFAAFGWQASNLAGMNTTINGYNITLGSSWSGNAINASTHTTSSGLSLQRQGGNDTQTNADFAVITASIGTTNVGLNNPWGCSAITRTAVTATVNPVPDASTTQTDVTCYNGSNGSATVNATSGTTPYSYSWNTTDISQTVPSLVAGTYTVVVSDANACTDTASVVITQPVIISASITQNDVCGSATTGLANATVTGGTGAYSYEWNTVPAQTTPTASNLAAGTYTLTVTDANMCSNTFEAIINSLAVPTVTAAYTDTTICESDTIILIASGADTYLWNNGAGAGSSVNVSPVSNTIYIVTGTAINGCASTDTVDVNVNPLPVAGFTYTGTPTVTFTNTSTNSIGATWDYGDGSPAETAANPTHIFTADGTYHVVLTVTNNCGTDTVSQQVVVIGTAIGSMNKGNMLSLVPNPSQGMFNLAYSSPTTGDIMIRILDVNGKVVYNENFQNNGSGLKQNIDLSNNSKGVYFLQLNDGINLITKQVVIQ